MINNETLLQLLERMDKCGQELADIRKLILENIQVPDGEYITEMPMLSTTSNRHPGFSRTWTKLGFTEEELQELERQLISAPDDNPVVAGTGGARKVRYARQGQGKSGGVRVIYAYIDKHKEIYIYGDVLP